MLAGPMLRFSSEFRVGLFTLLVLGALGWAITKVDDRPGESGAPYALYADFPTVEGVFVTTPIRIAGVRVGHVDEVELRGGVAHLTLAVLDHVELPVDSVASLKSEGLLGDKSVRITPGTSTTLLKAGDTIMVGDLAPDMERVTRQVNDIAADIKVITSNVRALTEDETTKQELLITIRNVRQLSEQLNAIAANNSDDISVIAANLREVSEALKLLVANSADDVAAELDTIQSATAKLDATLAHVESIAAGIERGEGTLGKLVKDPTTIDSVNGTIESVNDTIETVNGILGDAPKLRTEVYYRGDVYFGSEPTDAVLTENPVAGRSRNGVGVRLFTAEDHWYLFELAGHPQGDISTQTHVFPDFGSSYEEIVVKPGFRMSFQFARRWHDAVLRFGVKDNAGGVGFDYYLAHDKLVLGVDLFDFVYGSYPLMNGTPNLQVNARFSPWRHVYVEAGLDSVLMGARHGYVAGYGGGGFYFDDADVKFILAALPLKP